MSNISEEEENYVRMSLLMSKISPRAVRVLFDSEFYWLDAEITLSYYTLKDLKNKKIINQSQWRLLFPKDGRADSRNFDLTLMIALLTNLTELKNYDELPLNTDTSPSADLARIKYYRNQIYHNKDGKIDNILFSSAWDDITEAIGRLAGNDMVEESKELRTQILDRSAVSWNIREPITQVLEAWSINDSNFVETRASKHVLECVRANQCVTLTASSGVGKTAILQHVALKMVNEGYNVIPVTNNYDIYRFYHPNQKTLFVLDDVWDTYSINSFDRNFFESNTECIQELIRNKLTHFFVALRSQVNHNEMFEPITILKTYVHVCNLQSEDLCLSRIEKQSIAESYLKIKAAEIIQYSDLYDCFPLLCKLYNHHCTEFNIVDFFKNPYSVYEAEIDTIHKKGFFLKYCALALCVMFNNELNEEWLTGEINSVTETIMESTFEACGLKKRTSRLVLLDELKSLQHSLIKKEQGVYKTLNDKHFDFLSFYFGKKIIKSLIRNGHSLLIMRKFALERNDDMDQFITVVPPIHHELYIQRIINEWDNGRLQCVFCNINMKVPGFRQNFVCYLKAFDFSRQRQLVLTCDEKRKDTVLIQCCQYDDIALINWCFSHGADVLQCNIYGVSPLYVAAHEDHTAVVQLLLDKLADINRYTNYGVTPLIIACRKNFIEVVKVLLEKEADINQCGHNGITPLIIACQSNCIQLVKLLLDNKADIDWCRDDGATPLHIACQRNHLQIVTILLANQANINKCANNGVSPLLTACHQIHVEIVKVLWENKADINKCGPNGVSPLFIACLSNFIQLINILLDNKADINKCTDNGVSPLNIACSENHVETVTILLAKKADINRCGDDGVSPLYTACRENYLEVVKILLDKEAHICKCTNVGISPLMIACRNNNVEIVKVLLFNKADIDKCDNNGITALLVSCYHNQLETVKVLIEKKADINKCGPSGTSPLLLLLDNKADINMCRDDGVSPLQIACKKRYIETVTMLLANKADINKCDNNGITALLTACHQQDLEIVKVLIENKADINKCGPNGVSPLFIVCQSNCIQLVKILLDNKADINLCSGDGVSPLHTACEKNYIETVTILLASKADITKCSKNGTSPLYTACRVNHVEIVKVLLENKADINKCRNDGISPLHCACLMKHIEIVKVLLDDKSDIHECKAVSLYKPVLFCGKFVKIL